MSISAMNCASKANGPINQTMNAEFKKKPSLGENLKRLRRERGWNLSTLAKESGLPQSTLSKVETGQMSLNYEKLLQLAETFDVDIRNLFASPTELAVVNGTMGRLVIEKASDQVSLSEDHYKYSHLSTTLKNRLMIPLLFEVDDARSIGDANKDGDIPLMDVIGERFAYVIKGPVDFHCEHYETVTLSTGDSLYVDAAMPHAFVAPKGKTAKVLTVLTSQNMDYLRIARDVSAKGDTDATPQFKKKQKRKRVKR